MKVRCKRAQNPRPHRLYVYGISAEEWTRRHGIEPFSHACSECGRMCTTTLPFVDVNQWGDWNGDIVRCAYGLASPPCECGNERTPYGVVF